MMVGRSDGRRADCPPSCNVRERAREPALFTHPRFYHSAGYCTSCHVDLWCRLDYNRTTNMPPNPLRGRRGSIESYSYMIFNASPKVDVKNVSLFFYSPVLVVL